VKTVTADNFSEITEISKPRGHPVKTLWDAVEEYVKLLDRLYEMHSLGAN